MRGRTESMIHELKCWIPYFEAVSKGFKTFEVRLNDRDYRTGDLLRLREYDPTSRGYTGRCVEARVTYCNALDRIGIPGYVGMSVELMAKED